jgi:ketosteroid isomerase-like protein
MPDLGPDLGASPGEVAAGNRRLIEDIFAALAEGDSRPLVEAMDDDFAWTVMGRNPWAGTYSGKAVVLGELLAALRGRIDGRIRLRAERIFADGDHVIVEALGDNQTKDGRRYDNRYCMVIRVQDGRLKALKEYMDTELVAEVLGGAAAEP